MRILVVEDEATTALILREILEGEGYEVIQAENGIQAVEELERDPSFDLVIADMNMPKMNGLALMGRMQRDPDWREIPVLVCTAREDLDMMREANRRGARGYVDKHVTDREALLQKVASVLDQETEPPPRGGA